VDASQIEILERSKQRTVIAIGLTAASLLVLSALRYIPTLNDAISSKPKYVGILTETFAQQFATRMQMQFPVIVEHDEHGTCPAVSGPTIPDDEIRGSIYLLTYSEQQHATCISTYVVPMDVSRFPNLRNFTPAEGKIYGPRLLGALKAFAENRLIRVYAPEYLTRLHWRYKPRFPLSPSEAESLRSQSYYSGAKQPGETVSIDLDYGELRAKVAQRHREVTVALFWLLVGNAALFFFLLGKLWLLYRRSSQYSCLYELKLTPEVFLTANISTELNAARRQYFERQQETQARLREKEKLQALRTAWQEGLRSALPNLNDEQLRARVEECVEQEAPDLEQVKSLWVEVQERTCTKTPADKLNLLLESAKPYCTEEEFLAAGTKHLRS
jgi:hypothetical protein